MAKPEWRSNSIGLKLAPWMEETLDSWLSVSWPGWLCWLFGHEPTEPLAITKSCRCRCSAVTMRDEDLINAGRPNWWTRLVKSLPARRQPQVWRGYVRSSGPATALLARSVVADAA